MLQSVSDGLWSSKWIKNLSTFCCSNKWFTIDVYDTDEKHVGHFERPIGCLSCWCGCCSQTMRVNFPPTKFMGEVLQKWSLFGSPSYQWVVLLINLFWHQFKGAKLRTRLVLCLVRAKRVRRWKDSSVQWIGMYFSNIKFECISFFRRQKLAS